MTCTGAKRCTARSMDMYFMSSISNMSRLGFLAMNAAYSSCRLERYRKSYASYDRKWSTTIFFTPSMEPVNKSTSFTISMSDAISS